MAKNKPEPEVKVTRNVQYVEPETITAQDPPQEAESELMVTSYNPNEQVTMEMARRCPICWGVHQGTGNQYSADGATKYYKCQGCGHTWTAKIYIERIVIEHRKVEISTREVP